MLAYSLPSTGTVPGTHASSQVSTHLYSSPVHPNIVTGSHFSCEIRVACKNQPHLIKFASIPVPDKLLEHPVRLFRVQITEGKALLHAIGGRRCTLHTCSTQNYAKVPVVEINVTVTFSDSHALNSALLLK